MENIPLPKKVEAKKIADNKAEITIEPLYPGYGTTMGNALRRVLLSSLSGAAITSVKISGVEHEFSTIAGVKEDVVDILLNLKKIRIKMNSDEETKLKISVSGDKKVTAADIKKTSGIEIANSDCLIATLTEKTSKFEAELTVRMGKGYVPVEQREKEKLEIGNIAIDAIFTPIKLVNYTVENVRVGQMTNYNRLRLIIETDGTVTPEQATAESLGILIKQFSEILDLGEFSRRKIKKTKKAEPEKEETDKDDRAKKDEEEENKKKEDKEDKKESKEDEQEEKEKKPAKKKRGRPKKEK